MYTVIVILKMVKSWRDGSLVPAVKRSLYSKPLISDYGACLLSSEPEEVVHTSLSVIAKSRVQQNLLFSSTYLQPIFNLLGVVMEHFKSLLLAFGRVCDAF